MSEKTSQESTTALGKSVDLRGAESAVAVGSGDAADFRESQGALYNLSGHVTQYWGGVTIIQFLTDTLLPPAEESPKLDLPPLVRPYADEATVPTARQVQSLEELTPLIQLYHQMVEAGQYNEAFRLLVECLHRPIYYQFGAYDLQIKLLVALFPDGENNSPRLKEASKRAWILNVLASCYTTGGQPRSAIPLFERMNEWFEKRNDKQNLITGLANLASPQMAIGALRDAEASLINHLMLCREIANDSAKQIIGYRELGRLLAYRGAWQQAEKALTIAQSLCEEEQSAQVQGITWGYRALRALLMARLPTPTPTPSAPSEALTAAQRALELAEETARTTSPVERDFVRAHWLLGAAHRLNGNLAEAEQQLTEALTRCRASMSNTVDAEAHILLDLARLRLAQGAQVEAQPLAEQALLITERSGYVLQGADVHLLLAQLALDQEKQKEALHHARQAKKLATCDGPPDYTYKVAYEEAGRLLARLESPPAPKGAGGLAERMSNAAKIATLMQRGVDCEHEIRHIVEKK